MAPRIGSNLWTALASLALLAGAGAGGWWLGQHNNALNQGPADRSRAALERQLAELEPLVTEGQASDAQRQRLLELLVGLGRRQEAIALLEGMADRQPERWSLRLLLAELRRQGNDRSGAEREVRQVLNRDPDRIEALQLIAQLQLEQGRGASAEALLQAALGRARQPQPQPRALAIGLLLADLQQRRRQSATAEALYRQLAADFPRDPRPLLALALLRQEQGDLRGAQELLAQARQRQPERPDPRLDQVAAGWSLAGLRQTAEEPPGRVRAPSPAEPTETPPEPAGPPAP